jgi:hypothetical protein
LKEFDRRAFLVLGFGAVLSGCMGTYWKGPGELEEKPLSPPPARPKETEDIDLAAPIYEDHLTSFTPNLRPISRRLWSLRSPRFPRLQPIGRIWRVTVHHEGNPSPNYRTDPRNVAENLRQIQKVHMEQSNAGDIGYHFVIDRAGRIWAGRNVYYRGAHAGGKANEGNIGIMCLGNFDLQDPTLPQCSALKAFVRLLLRTHGLSSASVRTHRELRPTRCPGDRLQAFVDRMRLGL